MAFTKGKSGNPRGRKVGAKGKIGLELRAMITNFLEENFVQIQADFRKLKPLDRLKIYGDLLPYGLPKLQSATLQVDFEKFTDQELDYIIEQLKNTANDQINMPRES